jgi:hypothetical protein
MIDLCPSGRRRRPPARYVEYADLPFADAEPPAAESSVLLEVLMSDVVLSLLMILAGVGVVLLCKYG